MIQALAELIGACPALQAVNCAMLTGYLSSALLVTLGNKCPLLNTMMLCASAADDSYLKELVPLQPSLLPRLQNLTILGDSYDFPNMSMNTSIICLYLDGYCVKSESEWLSLPPKLRGLHCKSLNSSPPATSANGTALLSNLWCIVLGQQSSTNLGMLAQLLRAAPALRLLKDDGHVLHNLDVSIQPFATLSADLSLLHAHMDLDLVKSPRYRFDCSNVRVKELLRPFFVTLPRMTAVKSCCLQHFSSSDVGSLMEVFPNLQNVHLDSCTGFDDPGFVLILLSCARLVHLRFEKCHTVTMMGLNTLGCRHPTLRSVSCDSCAQLKSSAMDQCAKLFKMAGVAITLSWY